MHPANLHNGRYDFELLGQACSELTEYMRPNPAGDRTIDFSDEAAVRCLNRALLTQYYGVVNWHIPEGFLCPAIPGRADYIHYLADLIGDATGDLRVLDVGTGANCIYPIIGSQAYGWKFVGTEIDPQSAKSARSIVALNACLKNKVRIVHQKDPNSVFRGIIKPADRFAATMCNPPFHATAEAAQAGSQRKVRNLSRGKAGKAAAKLNFGGQANELWCEGGERAFIGKMIRESGEFASQVGWFTTLVSKSEHLPELQSQLARLGVAEVKIIPMQQGQKISRILAWRF